MSSCHYPDASLPGEMGETQVVQTTGAPMTTLRLMLVSAMATHTPVLACLQDHGFAHSVCHGILDPWKPFDASFKLYSEMSHLSLPDMVGSRLPEAAFAFLQDDHMAELTEESVAEEVLHLTAAVQYGGFWSVVRVQTMWEMTVADGQDLAFEFCEVSLVTGGYQEVQCYKRPAEAFQDAVKIL